jgi:hypothetical protein
VRRLRLDHEHRAHLLCDRVAQQVAVLEHLSGAQPDLLCTDGIAALAGIPTISGTSA